jgi:uncharacterized damage-inducible protein DinB
MIGSIADFEKAWTEQSANTEKVMRALTDASLNQPVAPGGRTLGRIAWHIVQTLTEMGGAAGLKLDGHCDEQPQPATATAIADAYAAGAKAVARAVAAAWSDADLAGEITMYGAKWTRGYTLFVLLVHEIHHRGQMTVLMRQAGVAVPGVCGPSKEEWAAFGMAAQE